MFLKFILSGLKNVIFWLEIFEIVYWNYDSNLKDVGYYVDIEIVIFCSLNYIVILLNMLFIYKEFRFIDFIML